MKKLALLLLLTLSVGTINAQTKRSESITPNEIAKIQSDKMESKYSLNADQKSKIYKINLDAATSRADVKKGKNTDSEARYEIKLIDQKQRTEISKVLTADQKTKFNADNAKYDAKQSK